MIRLLRSVEYEGFYLGGEGNFGLTKNLKYLIQIDVKSHDMIVSRFLYVYFTKLLTNLGKNYV